MKERKPNGFDGCEDGTYGRVSSLHQDCGTRVKNREAGVKKTNTCILLTLIWNVEIFKVSAMHSLALLVVLVLKRRRANTAADLSRKPDQSALFLRHCQRVTYRNAFERFITSHRLGRLHSLAMGPWGKPHASPHTPDVTHTHPHKGYLAVRRWCLSVPHQAVAVNPTTFQRTPVKK